LHDLSIILNDFTSTAGVLWCQNCIRPRLCPGPRCGSLRSSPDSLVAWGWGRPLPILSTPSASRFGRLRYFASYLTSPNTNSWHLATPLHASDATHLSKQFWLRHWWWAHVSASHIGKISGGNL